MAETVVIAQPLSYSPETAAEIVGIGRTSIYEEIKAGRLTARKLNTRTLIEHDELQRWLQSLPVREAS